MEDLRSYIDSGILELYVLGDLLPEENNQVREMAAKYPEVKRELDEIERSLELYAHENAVEPSYHQREKILNSLMVEFDGNNDASLQRPPYQPDNVVAMPVARNNFYKYAFAACLALLLLSLAALISVYNQLQNSNLQIAALSTQNQKFSSTVNYLHFQLGVFRDPAAKFVKLSGTKKEPLSKVALAWIPAKKKLMIDLSSMKLPANDKSHQYQLWALVGSKPIDLGVFDASPDSTGMKEMKPIAMADAFAVTLEPRGGSVTPTLDEMVVIGKF